MNYKMAERGKKRRLELGLRQADVAARMGIVQGTYWRFEVEGVQKFETIRRWAAALEMTFDALAFDPEELAEASKERAAEIDHETLSAAGEL